MTSFDSYYSVKATLGALVGVAVFLSNPHLYWYALITIPIVAVVYFGLNKTKSKVVLLASFSAISLYSFTIGRYFFEDRQLTTFGMYAIFLAIGAAIFCAYALLNIETERSA